MFKSCKTPFFGKVLLLVLPLAFSSCPKKKEEKLQVKPVISIEVVTIKKNDHLQAALLRSSLDRNLAAAVLDNLKEARFPFRYCRPSDSICIVRVNGTFDRLCYVKSPKEEYVVQADSLGLRTYMLFPYIDRQMVVVRGSINSSLYESMLAMGETGDLVYNFADVFAWEIDFFTETQNGDSFEVLVEKEFIDAKLIGYSRILYAHYHGEVGDFVGIYFEDPKGYDDFYNLKGESLRKSLLKSPLRYSRVSSFYSGRRLHPILRIYRPHHGIDYVAPAGTPVSSIGNGRVTFAGRKGGYGRLVEVRHPNDYKTRYGHLMSIASGVVPGKYVKMGDLLGYVGSSGMSTGPHLHFEFHVNGRPVNPLKIKIPRAPSVKKEYRPLFETEKAKVLQLIEKLKTGPAA